MAKIKEIWCMPHSHLDIGYTHPQPLLLELQVDYIDQAMDLCLKTQDYPEGSKFCWTIEATCVLKKWLETASAERIEVLKKLIKEKRICVAALPMHTTPNSNANEMVHMLSDLQELRSILDADIKVAINHDVNGQPWTMGQVLLDSGIDFYLTGINIHFGGIPFKRPADFMWEMADGRKLHSFLGEHYSLFSQFMFTDEHSTARMHEGVLEYVARLEKGGYNRDFAFLTATNPPLYDNNCPDLELADLVRKYNEEGHEQKIRIVTAEMLRDKLRSADMSAVPVHRGDWTDYWNFGGGSTARETRVSRLAKQTLQKAEVVECFNNVRDSRFESVKKECYKNAVIFDEHTWGASQSVTQPDSPETYSQLVHKVETAYKAADLSGYLLANQMEKLCQNPHQSNGLSGLAVVNTSAQAQRIELVYPEDYTKDYRQLSALRTKTYVPYMPETENTKSAGVLEMPPMSYKMIPFEKLEAIRKESKTFAGNYHIQDNVLETPYYRVDFDRKTGRIGQIFDIRNQRNLLDENRGYTLFEPVRESIDEFSNPPVRSTLFPRDVDLGNKNISQWNHDWKGVRDKGVHLGDFVCVEDEYKVTFVSNIQMLGMKKMKQEITFYTYSPRIHMHVSFIKDAECKPESLYFAVPLNLKAGWECSYDTAGEMVRLDSDQLGKMCRDWVTVDTGVSVYENGFCVTLACPDAPLVQVGDFNFGKESSRIERDENPLLLAWTLNNYWDTNFLANQNGYMEFAYDLFTYADFDAKQVLSDCSSAQNPCVIGVSAEKSEDEKSFLRCDGNSMVLHMYPAKKENAVILILKNTADVADNFHVQLLDGSLLTAEIVNVQEELAEQLESKENQVDVCVPARGLKLLRITRG